MILQTFKATRIERSLIATLMILIPTAFAGRITSLTFLLILVCIIAYVIGGLYNAKVDKDYELKHVKKIIAVLFILGLILSFKNLILFLTYISWFILGFIYSKYSRFILFGDSTVLALTHAAIPVLSSSLLLDLDIITTIKLTVFMFFNTWLVISMKNLNGVDKDKKLGYHTLMTRFKQGKRITIVLFELYFISMFASYFIFGFGNKFLFVLLLIFILKIVIFDCLYNGDEVFGYKLSKLAALLFALAIIVSKTSEIKIVVPASLFTILYGFYIVKNLKVRGVSLWKNTTLS